MTIIQCEFCGPERVAPHDVNCPTRNVLIDWASAKNPGTVVSTTVNAVGFTDEHKPYTHPLPDPNFLMDFPATVAAMQRPPEPLITRNPDHETMRGRFGAVCKCGYDPHETHPDAGRGQLFAYVGYHIREASRG